MVNKKKAKKICIISSAILIPGIVVGSYFGMASKNLYYKYFRSPITDDTQGLISSYLSAVSLGAKAIIAAGFDHYAPIEAAFKDYSNTLNDTAFLLLDSATDMNSRASYNTWSVNFRSDLGSFRTGVATSLFLNENKDVFKSSNAGSDLTIGMYGGMPYSSVTSFMGGMQSGVKWFNENLVGMEYNGEILEEVKIINPMGKDNFAGGFGASQGDSIIQKYLSQPDIDAFMPVAGPQVWSAQRKIIELNKKTIIIGVDAAIEDSSLNKSLSFTNNGKQVGNGKYIQFSSVKRLDLAVEKALNLINNGNMLPSNAIESDYDQFVDETGWGGIGTVAIGNIQNGCVGVSGIGNDYYIDAINLAGFQIDTSNDPSLSKSLSVPSDMNYYPFFPKTNDPINFGDGDFGLAQKWRSNVDNKEEVLDIKGFVKEGQQEDSNYIKIVGSGSATVLFDSSFNESAYIGLYEWYKKLGIKLPEKGNK